jgi:hypothetical protein
MTAVAGALDRAHTVRRGKRLEYFTILWNSLEGIIAICFRIPCGKRCPCGLWL